MSFVYRHRVNSNQRVTPSGPVTDERHVYAVGFFIATKWEVTFECDTEADARLWVHYLNGGDAPRGLEPA